MTAKQKQTQKHKPETIARWSHADGEKYLPTMRVYKNTHATIAKMKDLLGKLELMLMIKI